MVAEYALIQSESEPQHFTKAVYGIQCTFTQGKDKKTHRVLDISSDAGRLEHWVGLMNELELNPIHFYDVVEDILFEEYAHH